MRTARLGSGAKARDARPRGRQGLSIRCAASGHPPPSPPSRAGQHLSVRAAAQLTAEERLTLAQDPTPFLPDTEYRHNTQTQTRPAQNLRVNTQTPMSWVFSYGGNMCCETLARRDVSVATRDPAFVVDPSVRLVFKHRGGHATLESLPPGHQPRFRPPSLGASRQACVHGVLYRIPTADLKLMESRDQGYVLTQMEIETYEGMRVMASVWVSGALTKLPQEVTPPELYMRKLREGAAFNFLDPVYQAWLSSIETVTSAGLGSEYYNTPGRYINYSLLLVSLAIVGGWLAQHL